MHTKSEKKYIEMNGVKQGFIIEYNERSDAPVLLFIHGGPGSPIFPLAKKHDLELNQFFHVCYWDQRGTGMSYYNIKEISFNVETLLKDTTGMTEYLLDLFDISKIFILGHSSGSYLASLAVHSHPNYYHAYIGVGQIGDFKKSEMEKLDYLLNEAKRRNDEKALRDFKKIDLNTELIDNRVYGNISMKYLLKYNVGMVRQDYTNIDTVRDIFSCPLYNFKEKTNIFKGMFQSFPLLQEIWDKPLHERVNEYKIPVYILNGKYDYLTSIKEAKNFFEQIVAPKKKFFKFEHSAHSPFIDEKEKFYEIILYTILKNYA